MFRVIIQNKQDSLRKWQADFFNQEDAESWLNKQKSKEGRSDVEADSFIENLLQNYNYLLEQCYFNRRKAYPPMEDYMDAIVKGDDAQAQAYIDACLAVKVMYPKPSEE